MKTKTGQRIAARLLREVLAIDETLPEVSIVLPTYNGARYIRQSINSCLAQTYRNIELIIVDDGSMDETSEIIKSYKDERIKYIRHDKNKGLPTALNTGFANATGKYFTWTSDDNQYLPEAIEKMLSFLKDRDSDFVYCDYYRFKDDDLSNLKIIKLPDVLALEYHNDVGACFLYSRAVKEYVGDYDTEVVLSEDCDYWIRVSKRFSMYHLAEPLYLLRTHGESLSISRFHEVRATSILVRMKNGVIDNKKATDLFITNIVQQYPGYFEINKTIVKILFSRRINKILRYFESGRLDFTEAKLALKDIAERLLSLSDSSLLKVFSILLLPVIIIYKYLPRKRK